MEHTSDSKAADEQQDTARALLEAASRLFSAKGYEAVSTREIAQEAGANLAAIRYHFGSKELLFNAVVKNLMQRSLELREMLSTRDMSSASFSEKDATELLQVFIKHFLVRILDEEEPQGCRLMLRESASISRSREELVQKLVHDTSQEFIQPLIQELERLIQALCQFSSGESKNVPLNITQCVHSIIGQCFFYSSHRLFIEHLEGRSILKEVDSIAAHITNFSLRALGVQNEFVSDV